MYHPISRFVYTTEPDDTDHMVIIEYDRSLRLFFTQKGRSPLSAEKLLHTLNRWAKVKRVRFTATGIQIFVEEARCLLTHCAAQMLLNGYQHRSDWPSEYPYVAEVFARCPLGRLS